MSVGTAPGKVILFGEHAVVYGHPAIAIPLHGVQARVEIEDMPEQPAGRVRLEAPDIGVSGWLHEMDDEHRLSKAIVQALEVLGVRDAPAIQIQISSSIPMASGLGSSAAVTVALMRAMAARFGGPMEPERQSALAYQIEVLYHGTPSGVDNTVVAYEQPVWFRPGDPPVPLRIGAPFTLVIGDTGEAAETAQVVAGVRKRKENEPEVYELLFHDIAAVVEEARQTIERGDQSRLGSLMTRNQILLRQMGVSSASLERLIAAARQAGAKGAKLSGAGQGGNMIALVSPQSAEAVRQSLMDAGAAGVHETQVG